MEIPAYNINLAHDNKYKVGDIVYYIGAREICYYKCINIEPTFSTYSAVWIRISKKEAINLYNENYLYRLIYFNYERYTYI